jgi:hypothetical protein
MRWVIAEYENPLAVLFVVVAALLPWDVARATAMGGQAVLLYVRWPFLQWRRLASGGAVSHVVTTPVGAYGLQTQPGYTAPLAYGYLAWGAVAVLFGATLLFAVALYVREAPVKALCRRRLGTRPARVVGWALLLNGAGFLAVVALIQALGIAGLTLPIGALFMLGFGAVLLTNDPSAGELEKG